MDLSKLTHIILDVDGTMTDSGIYFGSNGVELKRFSSRDYVGPMAAHYVDMKVLIVTGREFPGTERRAKEMKVDEIYQNVKNKVVFIKDYMDEHGISSEQLGYIGDDLNDYASMKLAGFKACPSDAAPEIREICDYVSTFKGGTGVIQDVMRYVLNQLGKWDNFIEDRVSKGY